MRRESGKDRERERERDSMQDSISEREKVRKNRIGTLIECLCMHTPTQTIAMSTDARKHANKHASVNSFTHIPM